MLTPTCRLVPLLLIATPAAAQFSELRPITDAQADGAVDAVAADLDGDGDLDVLAGSILDDRVAWYENLGGGSFSLRRVICSEADNCTGVFAADLDGDGDPDVLSSSGLDNTIAWYENRGGGDFSGRRKIDKQVDWATDVHAADLDGDGDADVLATSSGDHTVGWYENLGGGDFGPPQVLGTTVYWAESVTTADLNGDGALDVLAASNAQYGRLVWFQNLGGGAFGAVQTISAQADRARDVHAADLDGDGDLDVLSASRDGASGRFAWYENLGGGAFGPIDDLAFMTWGDTVWSEDLDGDGDHDVLVGGVEIGWVENLGGGAFASVVLLGPVSVAQNVVAADLDGDGDPDPLSASISDDTVGWFENLGGGSFGAQQSLSASLTDSPRDVVARDLDGDGDRDVLTASAGDDKIAWHENLGGGEFGPQQVLTANAKGAACVDTGDLDGDGDPDVICASATDDRVSWFENLGGGAFGPRQVVSSAMLATHSARARDIDGDGDADLLVSADDLSRVVWFENTGGGSFGSAQLVTGTAWGVLDADAADLDGDGDADVMTALWTVEEVEWYENLGGGSFGAAQKLADLDEARHVRAVDLDGDGLLDVLSCGYNQAIWNRNLGGGSFGPKQNAGHYGGDVVAADLDGDGILDTANGGKNGSGGDTVQWTRNVGGSFGNPSWISDQASFPYGIAAADLDGDGDVDLLSASVFDDTVAWYENLTEGLGVNYCGPAVPNSNGLPAEIRASGSEVVADDRLTLYGLDLPTQQYGYFLASQTQGFIAGPGGSQGNLCLGGSIARFVSSLQSSGANGTMRFEVDLLDIPAAPPVAVQPGETWSFQLWFRDQNPTSTSNFTDGVSVTFQ